MSATLFVFMFSVIYSKANTFEPLIQIVFQYKPGSV